MGSGKRSFPLKPQGDGRNVIMDFETGIGGAAGVVSLEFAHPSVDGLQPALAVETGEGCHIFRLIRVGSRQEKAVGIEDDVGNPGQRFSSMADEIKGLRLTVQDAVLDIHSLSHLEDLVGKMFTNGAGCVRSALLPQTQGFPVMVDGVGNEALGAVFIENQGQTVTDLEPLNFILVDADHHAAGGPEVLAVCKVDPASLHQLANGMICLGGKLAEAATVAGKDLGCRFGRQQATGLANGLPTLFQAGGPVKDSEEIAGLEQDVLVDIPAALFEQGLHGTDFYFFDGAVGIFRKKKRHIDSGYSLNLGYPRPVLDSECQGVLDF
jgi:hypothetical protein